MLNCKQVTQAASDYLDTNAGAKLKWQIRLHLLMCANCRRFVKHLAISTQVSSKTAQRQVHCDPQPHWQKLQQRLHQTDSKQPPQ